MTLPVDRTGREFDHPLLFLAARTDTWVFRRPHKKRGTGKDEHTPITDRGSRHHQHGHLDVHAHPKGSAQQFTNDRADHAKLIAWITLQQATRIISEATGAYHRGLQKALAKAQLPGVKINIKPWQPRRFAEVIKPRAETIWASASLHLAASAI